MREVFVSDVLLLWIIYSHRDQKKASGRRKEKWYMEVVDGKKVKQMESVYNPGGQQVARGLWNNSWLTTLDQVINSSVQSTSVIDSLKLGSRSTGTPEDLKGTHRGHKLKYFFDQHLITLPEEYWDFSLKLISPTGPTQRTVFLQTDESMRMKSGLVRAKL